MGKIRTKKGYDLYVIASALQKSIRRGDAKIACYCGLELFHSGFHNYVWKRLLTISAEDVYDALTMEVWALYQAFLLIREKIKEGNAKDENKGRLFISKAILLLCRAGKSRDADHISNLLYDIENLSEKELQEYAVQLDEKIEMPEYTFDCHTAEGRRKGKTRQNFFVDEDKALFPRIKGEFDDLLRYRRSKEEKICQ